MKKTIFILLFLILAILSALNAVSAADPTTERVSTADPQSNGYSYNPSITSDGRYIAFESDADNIVSDDTNAVSDIFVKDGLTGQITRVSTSATGAQANGGSSGASITSDGRYIAFSSYASNLVPDDTNGESDVFVKDGWTGQITRVSTSATGTQGNEASSIASITSNGRYITFSSSAPNLVSGDTNDVQDVFVKDGWTGQITRVSTSAIGAQADSDSYNSKITTDGRYIVFESEADNLVNGDTNAVRDIFVKDGWTGAITRISTTAMGAEATGGNSLNAVITPDGRYIVFESDATNLVTGDTNNKDDIFVKDGWTGQITRVSTSATGTESNDHSYDPSITPDGRYIAFDSDATNLVSGDTNGVSDVFVKDGWTGAITRISTSSSGAQATGGISYNPVITPNGRYIAFQSDATDLVSGDSNGVMDIFVKDGWTGRNVKISTPTTAGAQATGGTLGSHSASITPDGRYIAFHSDADNLVSGDTNGCRDIFVHDNVTKRTIRVSTTSTGEEANYHSQNPSITPDGRYITFESTAINLVPGDTNIYTDIFVKDMWTGAITRVSTTSTGAEADKISLNPSITPDGRYITFESTATNLVPGDSNGCRDVFVKDGWTGAITRISTSTTGIQADGESRYPSITSDGRYIVFESYATNLVSGDTNNYPDIFVKDGWTGQITRVNTNSTGAQANGGCYYPSITPDGRYIVFNSFANNLVLGDTNGNKEDVFVKDMRTGAITRVSTSSTGAQADGVSGYAAITPDGRYITFQSDATNLVPGDSNGCRDVFVKDGWTGAIIRVSTTSTGAEAIGGNSEYAVITPDGRYIAFESSATNLVTGDTNGKADIFVYSRW